MFAKVVKKKKKKEEEKELLAPEIASYLKNFVSAFGVEKILYRYNYLILNPLFLISALSIKYFLDNFVVMLEYEGNINCILRFRNSKFNILNIISKKSVKSK